MFRSIAPLVFALTIAGVTGQLAAAQSNDEAEIRALQGRQSTAWNAHDATAYANLFTEDGEVINVVGWWWKDRREIETKLKAAFANEHPDHHRCASQIHRARRGHRSCAMDNDRSQDPAGNT